MKIGILIDSFKLPFEEALEKAAELKVDGIQMYTTSGRMSAWNLDAEARRNLRTQITGKGLEISALCGDFGGHGFEYKDENREKIRKTEAVLELAADLGAPVISTHIGVVPETKDETYRTLLLAMREIASFAKMKGVKIAIETGPEPALRLRGFIEDVGEDALGVNFDPANLVMVHGADPVESFKVLREFVFYSHAKDGRMVKRGDVRKIYDAFADSVPEDFHLDDYFLELPIGEGSVDFPPYLKALHSMGFDGYLTIEREAGDDRVGDITREVAFLRRELAKLT